LQRRSTGVARVFDRRGREISALDRLDDESLSDFLQRARVEAQNLAGAVRVVVRVLGALARAMGTGGLSRAPSLSMFKDVVD
jgi:hypothetical protein